MFSKDFIWEKRLRKYFDKSNRHWADIYKDIKKQLSNEDKSVSPRIRLIDGWYRNPKIGMEMD